jgi:hypothetical protein
MGLTSDRKHDKYQQHYPDGYELVDVPDDEVKTHPGLEAAYQRNQAPREQVLQWIQDCLTGDALHDDLEEVEVVSSHPGKATIRLSWDDAVATIQVSVTDYKER